MSRKMINIESFIAIGQGSKLVAHSSKLKKNVTTEKIET